MTERRIIAAVEAERAVLGACLLAGDRDRHRIDAVAAVLRPDDWGTQAHASIWRAVVALRAAGAPLDPATVGDELRRAGKLEQAGGLLYLSGLLDACPTALNVEHYARIVREASIRRQLAGIAAEIGAQAAAGHATGPELLAEAEGLLAALRREEDGRGARGTALREIMAATLEAIDTGAIATGTGITALDRVLGGGMFGGELVVLAGRPSTGKTALALNVAQHVAKGGAPVLFVSCEMSDVSLAMRLIAATGGPPMPVLRLGGDRLRRERDGLARTSAAAEQLAPLPLHVVGGGQSVDAPTVRAEALRLRTRAGSIGLVVVDYLQRMRHPRAERWDIAVGASSGALKSLAAELGCPVLLLSQLNRAVDGRTKPEPTLADLRDSGQIEQDADVVGFLWLEGGKEEADAGMGNGEARDVMLSVRKHRQGATGRVRLAYQGESFRFVSAPSSPDHGWIEEHER